MSSTQSSTTTGPVSVSCETGLLSNKLPGSSLDFDLYDPGHSIDSLFGQAHTGAALLESILAWYLDSEQDVTWFADGGGDRWCAHSRPLQEVTVSRYADRIREEGLSQIVAGRAGQSMSERSTCP